MSERGTDAPRAEHREVLDLRGMLRPERAALVSVLADLDEAGWAAPTECPAWSVQGIALHILGDDLSLLARQRDSATPGVFVYAEHHPGLGFRELLDGFNEQWVLAARFLSPDLIVELLGLTGEWTAAFYDATDPETLGEPVGFLGAAGPSPYWQICAREYVERWVHHQQILRALRCPDLGPDLLAPAADVIVTSLAAHLPDLGAGPGSTLTLAISDLKHWSLRRTDDRWTPHAGGDSDAMVTLDRGRAPAVLSRALTAAEASAAMTASGEEPLASKAARALAKFVARP